MSDFERRKAASEFFWSMVGEEMILTPQEADRLINQIARALPPFTPIKTSNYKAPKP